MARSSPSKAPSFGRSAPRLRGAFSHRPLTWTVSLLAALAGLGIAIYLSAVHLSSQIVLYCAENSVVNCETVITSPASIIFGIPVAFYGVVWFLVMIGLLVAPHAEHPIIRYGRLAWTSVGAATVLYLLYTELFRIGVICAWCSAVHLLVILIFALTVLFPTNQSTSRS